MMFPKHKTKKDRKLLDSIKEKMGCCELCGSTFALEAAHIEAKGMGGCNGPDIPENITVLCGPSRFQQGCHGLNHKGKISKDQLYKLAAKRQGITIEECKLTVRRAMGYNV